MQGYDAEAARKYIVTHLDPKAFRKLKGQLDALVDEMIRFDLQFMHESGVLDENGEQGENEYDDDEAFEYIYDAWLQAHPNVDDEEMQIAALINAYMELQYSYLDSNGLTDL